MYLMKKKIIISPKWSLEKKIAQAGKEIWFITSILYSRLVSFIDKPWERLTDTLFILKSFVFFILFFNSLVLTWVKIWLPKLHQAIQFILYFPVNMGTHYFSQLIFLFLRFLWSCRFTFEKSWLKMSNYYLKLKPDIFLIIHVYYWDMQQFHIYWNHWNKEIERTTNKNQ